MYTPYIMLGYAISLALCLAGFLLIGRTVPEVRGTRPLALFVLSGLGAVILIAVRKAVPGPVSVLGANFLFIAGTVCFYAAAAEILARPARFLRWLAILPVATIPLFCWTVLHPDLRLRLLVHCCAVAVCYAAAALLLFRHRNPDLRSALRPASWIVLSMVAAQLCWMLYPWLFSVQLNVLNPDAVDTGFSYLSMILALGSGVSLMWLSLSAHRNDLHRAAHTDSLTGLLNRGAFESILRRELQRSHRSGASLGIVLIDLDYFKQVNDSYGHAVGDRVLRRISAALAAGTRPCDVLARYGGEEFVVLLRDSGVDAAQTAAERIRLDVASLGDLPERLSLTASIGVATSLPGESPDELLLRADEALYRSKRDGRNLVSVYRTPRRPTLVSM